jgi:nifR3 family TIM-barrel protein
MRNIWKELNKPIFCLAPMEGATDTVFRRMLLETGKPDLMFTEFTSVDGLASKGFEYVATRLRYHPEEKPLIAQIWGIEPGNFLKATKLIIEMGFDGVDINMGCPDKDVVKKGSGAALINNHSLAKEIILATKEAAMGKIPVSIKTRIGFNQTVTEEWGEFLLKFKPAALIIHCRTARELSLVPARWDEISKVVNLRNEISPETLVVGNGDVSNLEEAWSKVDKYQIDGVMMGRAVFANPWVFNREAKIVPDKEKKFATLIRHIELFDQEWGGKKDYAPMKRFIKVYVNGFRGSSELRDKLMHMKNSQEVLKFLREYIQTSGRIAASA